MAATHPPSIPVRQTTKSLYRPISKLNGDQLPMLRRVKRPELSGRITLYNHYTERVLDTALNVSFRQHEHTMETIRKEQAQIYKSLCRIQKLKRRVQKDEHEQRRQEIRNMFNRQRRRHLMRRVVAKFRENVIKKRAERMIEQANEANDDFKPTPALSAQQLLKYAGGLRRHTQPNVSSDVQDVHASIDNDSKTPVVTDAANTTKTNQVENVSTQFQKSTDSQKGDIEVNTQINSQHKSANKSKKTTKGQNTNLPRKNSNTNSHLESIPEVMVTSARSKKKSRKPSQSASRKNIKSNLSSKSLPAIHQHINYDSSDETNIMQTKSHQSLKPKQSVLDGELPSEDLLIDQVVRENTFEEGDSRDFAGKLTHHGSTPDVSECSSGDDDYGKQNRVLSVDPSPLASRSTKRRTRRRNMVKVIENERAERAKARTRILDEEPFTRYSRKPQEKVSAMYGIPKRAEFIPPSGKLRHEQDKLIRKEQDKEIQSHINIDRFFHDVFQTKESATYRQPTMEKEEAPKKVTLSLASVLSQMYGPTESVKGDKNSMDHLKSCQYLRVYNPFVKKVDKERNVKQESSWDVAERKLRAGFMALSFLK